MASAPVDHARLLTLGDLILALGSAAYVLSLVAFRRSRAVLPPRTAASSPKAGVDFLLIPILTYGCGLLVASAFVESVPPDSPTVDAVGPKVSTILAGAFAQLTGSIGCLIVLSRSEPGGVRSSVLGMGLPLCRFATIGSFALTVTLSQVILLATIGSIRLVDPNFTPVEHPTINWLRHEDQSAVGMGLIWFSAVVAAPLGEELFFRGVLQTMLLGLGQRTNRAVAGSAALFALVHYPQPATMPALFVLGLILGRLRLRTQSLKAPIMVHSAFNLKTLIWDAFGAAS